MMSLNSLVGIGILSRLTVHYTRDPSDVVGFWVVLVASPPPPRSQAVAPGPAPDAAGGPPMKSGSWREQGRQPVIFLWGMNHFMYMPVMATLKQGLSDPRARAWKLQYQELAHPEILQRMRQKARPHRGDIFVWVGGLHAEKIPWRQLRDDGVYTIHYQSEPLRLWGIKACTHPRVQADDLWDYSWDNIEWCISQQQSKAAAQRKKEAKAGIVSNASSNASLTVPRFIPPGFIQGLGVALQQPVRPALSFLGNPVWRQKCWDSLVGLCQERNITLESVYNIWSSSAFAGYVKDHSIFVNIHKQCCTVCAMEAFRMSTLLSVGALVLSTHGNGRDEKEYEGMVEFLPLEDFPTRYLELVENTTQKERQALAEARAATFKRTFAPSALLQRAGIYELLDRLL